MLCVVHVYKNQTNGQVRINRCSIENNDYDDGSYGPLFVRLAWHASGTYSKHDQKGGSNGATMRFDPEAKEGANNGLDLARQLLEPMKIKYPGLS
jgi:cytochrome c peroxidase